MVAHSLGRVWVIIILVEANNQMTQQTQQESWQQPQQPQTQQQKHYFLIMHMLMHLPTTWFNHISYIS